VKVTLSNRTSPYNIKVTAISLEIILSAKANPAPKEFDHYECMATIKTVFFFGKKYA